MANDNQMFVIAKNVDSITKSDSLYILHIELIIFLFFLIVCEFVFIIFRLLTITFVLRLAPLFISLPHALTFPPHGDNIFKIVLVKSS
jgi:hypothetical protein